MITNLFRITVAILALASTAPLPISAGQVVRRKVEPAPKKMQLPSVYLRTYAHLPAVRTGSPCVVDICVTNQTRVEIPRGTTIYWSIRGGGFLQLPEIKGSFVLEKALINAAPTVCRTAAGVACSYVPPADVKAWYIPKAMPPV
jgi:hypothetical protein